MGAWDYGIFDDDTAYDFTDEIKEDARAFFKSSFEEALAAESLDYDACHRVTVSAAYIDNLLNGTTYRTDSHEASDESNVNLFGKLRPGLQVEDLRELAIDALEKVLGKTSELNELWSENEKLYPKWTTSIRELMARLKVAR